MRLGHSKNHNVSHICIFLELFCLLFNLFFFGPFVCVSLQLFFAFFVSV